MSAAMCNFYSMAGRTVEDIAADRLEEWNRWMNLGPRVGPAEPSCTLGRVQAQRVAAGAPGGPRDIPLTVDEVEKVVRRLSQREKQLITTFFDHSPMPIKASDCNLTPNGYWRAIQRVRRRVYSELY